NHFADAALMSSSYLESSSCASAEDGSQQNACADKASAKIHSMRIGHSCPGFSEIDGRHVVERAQRDRQRSQGEGEAQDGRADARLDQGRVDQAAERQGE